MNWQLRSILNEATEHLAITLAVVGYSLSIPLTIYHGANYGNGFTLDGLLSPRCDFIAERPGNTQ